jgi:hypothetical protein
VGAGSVLAASSPTVALRDPRADVAGPLDLVRASVGRAGDGRVRVAVGFAAPVTPRDMLALDGPPGSVCLRLWTVAGADPAATSPDRLVCVTARSADELRAGVLRQRDGGLPRRDGRASVRRTASGRSLIVHVSQSALGRPERLRFAVESTRPGCARPACVDTVPAAPATRSFRLR